MLTNTILAPKLNLCFTENMHCLFLFLFTLIDLENDLVRVSLQLKVAGTGLFIQHMTETCLHIFVHLKECV
jgi:hypothetical protein